MRRESPPGNAKRRGYGLRSKKSAAERRIFLFSPRRKASDFGIDACYVAWINASVSPAWQPLIFITKLSGQQFLQSMFEFFSHDHDRIKLLGRNGELSKIVRHLSLFCLLTNQVYLRNKNSHFFR